MESSAVLSDVPSGLRDECLSEYRSIIQNYIERRWSPAELSAGRFCEIVFSILEGYASASYRDRAYKPDNFVAACKKLEQHTHVPRSFQILIPRTLPALYEVRNNRGVGHVGGDVDSNHMDATFVVTSSNWILAELVRVFHKLSVDAAQVLVDSIVERRIPLIWQGGTVKRVLAPKMRAREQLVLLAAASPGKVKIDDLAKWIEYKNSTRFLALVNELHSERMIEFSKWNSEVEILPPGSVEASKISESYRLQF